MSDEELKQALEHIHVIQEALYRIRNAPKRISFNVSLHLTEISFRADKLENLISYAMIQRGIEP